MNTRKRGKREPTAINSWDTPTVKRRKRAMIKEAENPGASAALRARVEGAGPLATAGAREGLAALAGVAAGRKCKGGLKKLAVASALKGMEGCAVAAGRKRKGGLKQRVVASALKGKERSGVAAGRKRKGGLQKPAVAFALKGKEGSGADGTRTLGLAAMTAFAGSGCAPRSSSRFDRLTMTAEFDLLAATSRGFAGAAGTGVAGDEISSANCNCLKKKATARARKMGKTAAAAAEARTYFSVMEVPTAAPVMEGSAAAAAEAMVDLTVMDVSAAAPMMAVAAEAVGPGATPMQMFAGAERVTTVEGEQCAAGIVGGGHGDDDAEVTEPPPTSGLDKFLKKQRAVWRQRTEQVRRNRASFQATMGDLAGDTAHFTGSYTQVWQREQFVAACGNRRGANAEGLRGAPSGGYREGAPSAGDVGTGTGAAGIYPLGGFVVRSRKE